VKRILIFPLAAILLTANGCFLFKKEKEPEPVIVSGETTEPVDDQPRPEPEPEIEVVKPEIPVPDEETAAKIAEALKKFQDGKLQQEERQDALLKDLAALGTISYGDILRLLGDPNTPPGYAPKIFKFFILWPDAQERDTALVTQLFSDDLCIRTGSQKTLQMLHPKAEIAYDPSASEKCRYLKILEWEKKLGIQLNRDEQD